MFRLHDPTSRPKVDTPWPLCYHKTAPTPKAGRAEARCTGAGPSWRGPLVGEETGSRASARSENRQVDILNVHDNITDTVQAARMAAAYRIRITVGNTALDMGVHVAAALPQMTWME